MMDFVVRECSAVVSGTLLILRYVEIPVSEMEMPSDFTYNKLDLVPAIL
jgi:hypothetical protein